MNTCKDCLHREACNGWKISEVLRERLLDMNRCDCKYFTNRSEWVHLPCKVGDAIYYPWVFDRACGIAVGEVKSIKISADNKLLFIAKDWESDIPMRDIFILSDFGDIVFLDYDEAEKVLERMKEDE